MLDIQQKRKVRSVMYSRVTIGILFVIVLLVLHSTWTVYHKKSESEAMKAISQKNVEELRLRNEELTARIARLSTKPGIEEEIRSKFNVAKDNEKIVIIVPDNSEDVSTTSKKTGFFEKIRDFFRK